MMSRVNWGAIWAGTVTGLGAALVLGILVSAVIGGNLLAPGVIPPVNGADALVAVVIAAAAFAATGAVTTLLGGFPRLSVAVAHSLAALALAYLFTHFFARDAFFVGRAGFNFSAQFVASNAVVAGATPLAVIPNPTLWTHLFAALAGIAGCLFGSYRMQGYVARSLTTGERTITQRAA